MDQLQQSLSKQGHSVSILFATYDLSPDAPYPRQLQQAALLLDHVLNSLHIPPENIILCGDSAGGNLALSLLSHVMHPHPSTNPQIPPLKVSGSFRGLVLVSPWVDFRTELPAYGSYRKDCLHPLALQKWSSAFLGHPYPFPREVLDEYNQPVLADEGWWVDIPVSSILIVGGRDEVLIDSIEEFGATLTRVKDRLAKEESGNGHLKEVQVFVAEGECHDQVNVDLDTGFTEPGKQAEMVRSWVAAHV
jgi:acetyl esterase/lipase